MADDTDIPTLRRILHENRRIAVVGISAEWHRPSFFVGKYLIEHGYTMIPVNPKYESVLGRPCFPNLRAAREKAGPIDLVDCFRRPEDIEPLLEYFTAYYARRTGVAIPRLTHECRASCRAHHWPGNMRQLQTAASLFATRTVPHAPVAVLESAERMCREQYTK